MYNIEKPQEDFQNLLNICIQRCIKDKIALNDFIPIAKSRADDYEEKAINAELHLLTLLENHLKGGIERPIYDKLINSAPLKKGSLCSIGYVSELDHYLPKSVAKGFPELAILPLNLIPCCHYCNNTKEETSPQIAEEQFIHPYYDNVDNAR